MLKEMTIQNILDQEPVETLDFSEIKPQDSTLKSKANKGRRDWKQQKGIKIVAELTKQRNVNSRRNSKSKSRNEVSESNENSYRRYPIPQLMNCVVSVKRAQQLLEIARKGASSNIDLKSGNKQSRQELVKNNTKKDDGKQVQKNSVPAEKQNKKDRKRPDKSKKPKNQQQQNMKQKEQAINNENQHIPNVEIPHPEQKKKDEPKSKKNQLFERDDNDQDIFIPGKMQNRAIEGDVVLVKLLENEELEREKDRVMQNKIKRRLQSNDRQRKCALPSEDDDQEEEEMEELIEERTYGKVVFIVNTSLRNRAFVGFLSMNRPNEEASEQKDSKSNTIWFKPTDKRIPFICIPKETAPSEFLKDPKSFENVLVTANVQIWGETHSFPLGRYKGKLGQIGQLPVETDALLTSSGIYWDDFSDEVLDCLPNIPWTIPDEEFSKRIDLRQDRIFSIDPITARDLDDAVSLKSLDDGTFELGVHIADVSYFVKPMSALDKEALKRATSVYLVQKVIPMLPRLLCEELCSLNPNVDRLAFSVFWNIDSDCNFIGEPKFARSIIRSCAKLSYEHAQAIIEGKNWDDLPPVEIGNSVTIEELSRDILKLYEFSKILRKQRFENGSLSMGSIKLWFKLDDLGNPSELGLYEQKDSNRLIEEYMLLANMAVAKKIASTFPEAALLRCHSPPHPTGLQELAQACLTFGVELDISSSKSLNTSFESIENPIHRQLIRLLCVKKMKRAAYFCTGSRDITSFNHYALGVPLYTHFTSPIRRYCDLIVHRMLDLAIEGKKCYYGTSQVDKFAEKCNDGKNASMDAQSLSSDLYLVAYLSTLNPNGIIAEAIVNKIGSRSFDVVIFEYGIENTVWIEDVLDQMRGIQKVEGGLLIHWHKGEEKIEIFSKVKVKVVANLEISPPAIKLYAICPYED